MLWWNLGVKTCPTHRGLSGAHSRAHGQTHGHKMPRAQKKTINVTVETFSLRSNSLRLGYSPCFQGQPPISPFISLLLAGNKVWVAEVGVGDRAVVYLVVKPGKG